MELPEPLKSKNYILCKISSEYNEITKKTYDALIIMVLNKIFV